MEVYILHIYITIKYIFIFVCYYQRLFTDFQLTIARNIERKGVEREGGGAIWIFKEVLYLSISRIFFDKLLLLRLCERGRAFQKKNLRNWS